MPPAQRNEYQNVNTGSRGSGVRWGRDEVPSTTMTSGLFSVSTTSSCCRLSFLVDVLVCGDLDFELRSDVFPTFQRGPSSDMHVGRLGSQLFKSTSRSTVDLPDVQLYVTNGLSAAVWIRQQMPVEV